jgi:hypothetical protein
MIPNSHQREMLVRALDSYEEDLAFDAMNGDPDKAEWSKVELQEVAAMRHNLKLESR